MRKKPQKVVVSQAFCSPKSPTDSRGTFMLGKVLSIYMVKDLGQAFVFCFLL
jgi:hypothetical protein